MNLYLEKCLEMLYDRALSRSCSDETLKDLEHVLIIVKQRNNEELAELLGLEHRPDVA